VITAPGRPSGAADGCGVAVLDMLNGVREWFHKDGRLTRDEVVGLYQGMILKLLG
jgi:hypothetical protein